MGSVHGFWFGYPCIVSCCCLHACILDVGRLPCVHKMYKIMPGFCASDRQAFWPADYLPLIARTTSTSALLLPLPHTHIYTYNTPGLQPSRCPRACFIRSLSLSLSLLRRSEPVILSSPIVPSHGLSPLHLPHGSVLPPFSPLLRIPQFLSHTGFESSQTYTDFSQLV